MHSNHLFHRTQGQGEPLVLIHGLFGSHDNLGMIARLLAEHFTVYSIDLPNHGRSPHSQSTNLDQMVAQVSLWLDSVGLDCTHILGHSLGGKVAMEMALRYPDRVKQLIIMDIAPVLYQSQHNSVFEGLLAIDVEKLNSRSEADQILKAYVEELPVRSFLLKNLSKSPQGNYAWRMNLSALYEGYSQLIRENSEGARFEGKTLFLKGGNSDYIQDSHKDAILNRFPATSLKVVANTGHWLHAEKPEIIAKLAIKFLS